MKNIRKYKVVRGLFYDRVFHGTLCGGRVWDEDSYGHSYPLEHCEPITNKGESHEPSR